MKDFDKTLQKILDRYGINASQLAKRMNVQRSGVSHLLAGRNKPSLDFIVRLLEIFPELTFDSLLSGELDISGETLEPVKISESPAPTLFDDLQDFKREKRTLKQNKKASPEKSYPKSDHKTIVKVILFYNDGHFEAFEKK